MIVSRRSFAAVAASGVLAAQAARAAPQLGNPDNPLHRPDDECALKKRREDRRRVTA